MYISFCIHDQQLDHVEVAVVSGIVKSREAFVSLGIHPLLDYVLRYALFNLEIEEIVEYFPRVIECCTGEESEVLGVLDLHESLVVFVEFGV